MMLQFKLYYSSCNYVEMKTSTCLRVQVEVLSDDDDDDSVLATVSEDKYWPQSLDKMVQLVAHLVEKSRLPESSGNTLALSEKDRTALIGGKVSSRTHVVCRQCAYTACAHCRCSACGQCGVLYVLIAVELHVLTSSMYNDYVVHIEFLSSCISKGV